MLSLLAIACAGVVPLPAAAHGDLASEYLVGHDIFLPVRVRIPAHVVAELASVLGQAKHDGLPVKVALVAKFADLGRRTTFLGKPQRYAQWVTEDIYADYHGRLLVVMPGGYGASVGGGPDPSLQRAYSGLAPPGRSPVAMVRAAGLVVRRLAASQGDRLTLPKAGPNRSNSTSDRLKVAALLVGSLVLGGFVMLVRRRLRTRSVTLR